MIMRPIVAWGLVAAAGAVAASAAAWTIASSRGREVPTLELEARPLRR